MNVYYAVQTCDSHYNFVGDNERVVNVSKADLIKVCLNSFLRSVEHAASLNPNVNHIVNIFDDRSSEETLKFLNSMVVVYSKGNVHVAGVVCIQTPGVMGSIGECYDWLKRSARNNDLIYQVQDDYLFEEKAIFEMIDLYYQMKNECDADAVISSTNVTQHWASLYRNRPTPRTIICGRHRLWIQNYDSSCSFMTTPLIFQNNWDLFNKFLSMPGDGDKHGNLENVSLNYLFTKRGILGLMPINSLALHMQREQDLDVYANWKEKWDSASWIINDAKF